MESMLHNSGTLQTAPESIIAEMKEAFRARREPTETRGAREVLCATWCSYRSEGQEDLPNAIGRRAREVVKCTIAKAFGEWFPAAAEV